jgi:hypothetical protein
MARGKRSYLPLLWGLGTLGSVAVWAGGQKVLRIACATSAKWHNVIAMQFAADLPAILASVFVTLKDGLAEFPPIAGGIAGEGGGWLWADRVKVPAIYRQEDVASYLRAAPLTGV